MKPYLCFESSKRLLVAWGDCLLRLNIKESTASSPQNQPPNDTSSNGSASSNMANASGAAEGSAPATTLVRRRTVECDMAWQLDCVACGMAPLDLEHVMVLGAVLETPDDLKNGGAALSTEVENEIELQIISRASGQVVDADLLPMIRKQLPPAKKARSPLRRASPSKQAKAQPESLTSYQLLSTFHLPRMDDNSEVQQQVVVPETSFDLFGGADQFGNSAATAPAAARSLSSMFRDPHLRWQLDMVNFDVGVSNDDCNGPAEGTTDDDMESVDSDNYDFLAKDGEDHPDSDAQRSRSNAVVPPAPNLLVVSKSDAISVHLRTIDDAIDHLLGEKKAAAALQRAIVYLPRLREFTIGEIVSDYYQALLRVPLEDADPDRQLRSQASRRLSLRRMKLAACSMPVLLGGDVDLWARWIGALGDIPGSLFVAWSRVPVRDPILKKEVYTGALCRMIEHVDDLRKRDDAGVDLDRLVEEAENHFLRALLAWGSTLVLKEFLKLYKYQADLFPRYSALVGATENSLIRRYNQTSAIYLSFPVEMEDETILEAPGSNNSTTADKASLCDCTSLDKFLTRHSVRSVDSIKVVLEAKARLSMMTGDFDAALRHFLTIGALHGPLSLEEVEKSALHYVMGDDDGLDAVELPHAFVVSFIENRSLHRYLLDSSLISGQTPIFALLRLVGLDLVGGLLMKNCVGATEEKKQQRATLRTGSTPREEHDEKRATMPLDVVAAQLESNPKIYFWYLHSLFVCKPELYVSFPKTANPPTSITSLHRKAFDLYIQFAGEKRDSSKALQGVETYLVTQVETPLLSFLRVVLPLGGISAIEAGKRLRVERKGGTGVSHVFALELAYIMENFGNKSEQDSRLILDLFLKGATSLMHAVAFAQRSKEYSSTLWEILIEYCLKNSASKQEAASSKDGSLFGLLLESAALSGANLAYLVSQIPPGMSIEGLRPRLVAAVADYRWKLQMHDGASQVANTEKVDLLREVSHRARRGVRYHPSDRIKPPEWTKDDSTAAREQTGPPTVKVLETLPRNLRPRERKDHSFLAYALPYQ